MKQLFLLLIILITSTTIASAQLVRFGVKGGININASDFVLKNGNIDNQLLSAAKNHAGYHVGLVTRFNLGALYVQGDVLYVRNAYEYNLSEGKIKIKENRLSIPAVVGLNILFLRVYAGPKFDFNLGQDLTKTLTNADAIKHSFDNRWLGYQLGVGADLFKRISIDFNYNGYFKAPTQQYIIGGNDYQIKQKSRQYWVSLGYYFGGGDKKYKKK